MVKKDKAANKADKHSANTKPLHRHKQHNKHNKQPPAATYTDFATQLASLHLRLQHIEGDGNCLFRSIADQVEGVEANHARYRQLACTHIAQHSELYAPFIDGGDGGKAGEGLKPYVTRMSRAGEWGGNMELVALARALRRDVVVHQLGAPRLVIDGSAKGNSSGGRVGALHLSYHDNEHYSSVRRADDHSVHSEPLPITLPASTAQPAPQQPHTGAPTSDERRVMAATAVHDISRVRAVLSDMAGDVDSAVEVLHAEQQAELHAAEQQPPTEAPRVEKTLELNGDGAVQSTAPVDERADSDGSDAKEAGEAKAEARAVTRAASKAKLSTKELRKALKAERADKKVQRAIERKVERQKERAQQAGEAVKVGSSAEDRTEGVVQDFGSLSI